MIILYIVTISTEYSPLSNTRNQKQCQEWIQHYFNRLAVGSIFVHVGIRISRDQSKFVSFFTFIISEFCYLLLFHSDHFQRLSFYQISWWGIPHPVRTGTNISAKATVRKENFTSNHKHSMIHSILVVLENDYKQMGYIWKKWKTQNSN